VTSASVHKMPSGLLQRSTGRNSWHSDKTSAVSTEYHGSFNVMSTTGPYHSNPTQTPLASDAEDRFEDRNRCVEMYP